MISFKKYISETKIKPENPLYGTENDPRLNINIPYKTSSDPLMARVMSTGPDVVKYTGGQYGRQRLTPEERAKRKKESTLASNKRKKETSRVKESESRKTGAIRTHQEVANILGLTKSRAHAIEKEAIGKLKTTMKALSWNPENLTKPSSY
jgi:hypothetical protein